MKSSACQVYKERRRKCRLLTLYGTIKVLLTLRCTLQFYVTTFVSPTIIEKRFERTPPNVGKSIARSMALTKSPEGSANIRIFPPAPCSSPQTDITKGSLTEMQIIS
uniref:Uncharacterized protein n=1 Tax=Glossina pallidipes TaxID=7398 RepID=A0A1A9ZZ79_GLOPL